MSLLISDDVRMIRESAGKLFADLESIKTLRHNRAAHDLTAAARGAWEAMTELGLPGILLPEAAGGAGLGMVASVQVCEMMGRSLTTGPFLSTAVMGALALRESGNTAQAKDALAKLAAGSLCVAIAVDETSRHNPEVVATQASLADGRATLSGRKVNVIDGNIADRLIVAARDTAGALGLFLVDAQDATVAAQTTMGLDSQPYVTITFNSSPADILCQGADATALLTRILDAGRLHLAAEMLGAAQEAFDRTVDYLKTRVQFGRVIGEFQALQHRAALLFGDLEICRSIVAKAAWAWDEMPAEAPRLTAMAKAKLSTTARHVTAEAVQLHGGIGVTDEFDIGLYLKRAQRAASLLGDSAFCLERYATLRGL